MTKVDLTPQELARLFQQREQSFVFENKRIISRDEQNVLRPSVAGLLAFGDSPEQFLPSAYIQAAAYRGAEMTHAAVIDSKSEEVH
ncbi:MAG: hypothetical protein ONB46_10845 [candidate division KSB1 bacterium]|nr:hypothetical protein [candidate division KSB1 bacterium]MDZ7366414.1 hypothetical protein [candidate division KSB1 bacterium]MDZ7404069.1 hypothetical protein [candidate division KSB1 bacterium]